MTLNLYRMASPESRVASASEIRVGTLERPFFLDPRAAERGRNREATLKQRYADSDISLSSVCSAVRWRCDFPLPFARHRDLYSLLTLVELLLISGEF